MKDKDKVHDGIVDKGTAILYIDGDYVCNIVVWKFWSASWMAG